MKKLNIKKGKKIQNAYEKENKNEKNIIWVQNIYIRKM